MEFRRQSQCVYYTRYHLVFVTKYRRKVLKHGMGAFVLGIMRRICAHYPDIQYIEGNCDEDHVHLLISSPPKLPVSKAVNLLKSNSARAMLIRFPFLRNLYDREIGLWADGYFVSTIGVNESVIKNYIERQGEEDSGQATLAL